MSKKKIDMRSSTLEKGLDLAKDFLGKLIAPTVEELGLLVAQNVKYLRFKNQVNILLKAKKYVESRNMSVKEIPIKILVPLLENASLEDNEEIQDKWAKMLVNMADSETNLQNQIFPYLLSQISTQEYSELKVLNDLEQKYVQKLNCFRAVLVDDKYMFKKETKDEHKALEIVEQEGFIVDLMDFEFENLTRLGLIRQLPPKIHIPEFTTGGDEYSPREEWHQISAEYVTDEFGYRITSLGQRFLSVCELAETKTK